MIKVAEKYKQTELGIIPGDWDVKTIDEAFDVCNNLRLPISEDIRKKMQGEYPYYGPTKIQDYLNEYRVEGEYALIGEDGDHFLKWKEIPMTQITSGKFNVNNHAHLIKGKKNISTTKWFYYFFKNRDITNHLTRQGAGRYKLSKSTLVKIPCAIPSTLAEQTAITTALSDADELISSLEKLITKKSNIKQGAMQKLLKPKDGWEVKKLGAIAEIKKGEQLNRAGLSDNDLYPVINGGVLPSGYTDVWNQKAETITISEGGNSCGYVNIIKTNFWQGGHCYSLETKIHKEFLYHLLKSNEKQIMALRVGSGLPNIQRNRLIVFEINLPAKEEQIEIATILSEMDAEIIALETKLEKYRMIKLGMMQNLLTGKIRLG